MYKVLNFIKKNKYIILLILLYAVFFMQMQMVFFYGDDYEVLYPLHNNHSFINVLNFCLEKMGYFWNQWSGRIIGHFTVSFGLSFFGIQFFRLLNPIMLFLMVYLIVKILSLFKKFDFFKCLFFLSLIVFGLNIYITRESIYWAYSSILYIWGFNLTLIVVYFIYKYYLLNKSLSIFSFFILMFLCLFQTFILEQLSFLVISFLFIMLVISVKNKKNYKYLIPLLLISILGFCISTFAPGNVLRTKPLVDELVGFSTFEIILGKIYGFFNIIFNPKVYGIYVSVFLLLINKRYLSCISGRHKFLKRIPWFILLTYFSLCLINNIFPNINILRFQEYFDTMNFLFVPPTTTVNYATIETIIIVIYYFCLTISIIYMSLKTMWKNYKFFFFSIGLTFISAVAPTVFIRFTGTRYYLYFFVALLLVSTNFILDSKVKSFDFVSVFLFGILVPIKYLNIIVMSVIVIVLLINKFFKNNLFNIIDINSLNIILFLMITISIVNFLFTLSGYVKNSKIYIKNEKILINSINKDIIEINEIPYRDSFYSWHSIVISCNNSNLYYGFYLDDFYSNYYGIDMGKVKILKENGDYVIPYY